MSFLAESYGPELIRKVVIQPRNGTAGIDAALEAQGESDRFTDAWQKWTVGNYASEDERYAYGALGGRRVTTIDVEVDQLPLQSKQASISGRWGTANIMFRIPGDLLVEFDGEDVGHYAVGTYAMGPVGGTARQVVLDAENRGFAQLVAIDSVVVTVGRMSPQGQGFRLSARVHTPTAVIEDMDVHVATALEPVYPNPFNSIVRVPFTIANEKDVELTVYDLLGHQVRSLVSARLAPGRHEAEWDGIDATGQPVASGVYFARLDTERSASVATLLLIH